jgi:hypothetical protein
MYYPMWEVHQLVTQRHDSLLRDAKRESLLRQFQTAPSQERAAWIDAVLLSERDKPCQLQATPEQDRNGRTIGSRWGWLAGLLGHWYQRSPETTQR